MKIDRQKFLRNLKDFIERFDVKVASDIPENSKILVTLVKDFDPESNDVWEIEGNKSYPREGLECSECHGAIVMSNTMFSMYSRNPMPEQVVCCRCAFSPERDFLKA